MKLLLSEGTPLSPVPSARYHQQLPRELVLIVLSIYFPSSSLDRFYPRGNVASSELKRVYDSWTHHPLSLPFP